MINLINYKIHIIVFILLIIFIFLFNKNDTFFGGDTHPQLGLSFETNDVAREKTKIGTILSYRDLSNLVDVFYGEGGTVKRIVKGPGPS